MPSPTSTSIDESLPGRRNLARRRWRWRCARSLLRNKVGDRGLLEPAPAPRKNPRRAARSSSPPDRLHVASPMPCADSTPASGWIRMRVMPSASATAQASLPARAAEAGQGVQGQISPRAIEILRIAAAILSTAMAMKPRAIASLDLPSPKSRGNFGQPRPRGLDIQRRVAIGSNTAGNCVATIRPSTEVAIGHRQRSAIPVAGRPRLRPADSGPTRKRIPSNWRIGSATSRHRMHLHHRRANAHARDQALLRQLEPPGIMRHVGRGPAHVEADQARCLAVGEMRGACRDHAHHPARRSRQDRILAAEGRGLGQPAVGLHELQRRVAQSPAATVST